MESWSEQNNLNEHDIICKKLKCINIGLLLQFNVMCFIYKSNKAKIVEVEQRQTDHKIELNSKNMLQFISGQGLTKSMLFN